MNWANISAFIIPSTLPTLKLPTKSHPSSRYLGIFSGVDLVSNYRGCKRETIKLIPYYMIDIIYKTVKPSHLKKLQVIQNMKNQMLQVIFIFSEWIFIKQIIVSSTPLFYWAKQIFEGMLPGRNSDFPMPKAWWREVGGELWVGRGISKNTSDQCTF